MGILRLVAALLMLTSCTAVAKDVRPTAQPDETKWASASVMVPLKGEFNPDNLAPVQDKLDELVKKGDKTLLIQIDSPGGYISTGWEFVSHMKNLKKKGVHVQCLVDWHAASMAATFLQAVCDERWAVPQAFILFHEGSSTAEGRVADLTAAAERLAALNKGLNAVNAKRMGMTLEAYEARILLGDWSMSADEALKAHAIDAIKETDDLPEVVDLVAKPDPLAALRKLLHG